VFRVNPVIKPFDSALQYGAPKPVNAGTIYTPSLFNLDFAIFSVS